jgi:cysteine desulfurase
MKTIYADNASSTRIADEVINAMMPYLKDKFANPSSYHSAGREVRLAVEEARRQIASVIACDSDEIYFTSGGTESDNWAIKGAARLCAAKGKHVITSKIEHHAVLRSVKALEREGFEITYLETDEYGFISPESLEKAIRPDTVLVSVMFANNETGAIQPIEKLAKTAKKHGILFHTDAVQAFGHIPINVKELDIDLLSFSGHKFNGPKGIGGLYIKRGVSLPVLIDGGNQENGRRGGTENAPAAIGMGEAARLAAKDMALQKERLELLRDRLIGGLAEKIPECIINTPPRNALPGIVNVSIGVAEGEALVLMLDLKGIFASSGSACMSGSKDPSHVLTAMGRDEKTAHGAVRFSFDRYTSQEDIDTILAVFPETVNKIRSVTRL